MQIWVILAPFFVNIFVFFNMFVVIVLKQVYLKEVVLFDVFSGIGPNISKTVESLPYSYKPDLRIL